MAGHECYHCKQWVAEGEAHDCWTTTEAALTRDLSDDLRDAWERLRETAAALGDQRIYASHSSIMFARKACYFFVRPKRTALEVCVFLGRTVQAPHVRRADPVSKTKIAHLIRIAHRDQVEAPMTDWLEEAYAFADPAHKPAAPAARKSARGRASERSETSPTAWGWGPTQGEKPARARPTKSRAASKPPRAKPTPARAKRSPTRSKRARKTR